MVEKDAYAEELSRYIHLNPVRAGLVKSPSEYRWSSYRYYIGQEREPGWLTTVLILEYFGGRGRRYREFVEKGTTMEGESPLRDVVASTFLGGEDFIRRIREAYLKDRKVDRRNIPAVRSIRMGPSPGEVEAVVAKVMGGNDPLSRKLCIHLSHQWSGRRLEEIGAHFRMKGSAVSQASRRLKKEIDGDKGMEKLVERIKKEMLIVET